MESSIQNNNTTTEIKIVDVMEHNPNEQLYKEKYKKKSEYPNFLLKLYQILENDEYKDIVHWGENGRYFIVQNLHDFTEKILPIYYKHNNYSSFIRQLNMYDFHKKKSNQNEHIFHHQFFIKDRQDLIKTIKRKSKKEKEIIHSSNYIPNYQKANSKNIDIVPVNNIDLMNKIKNSLNNSISKDNTISDENNIKYSLSNEDDLNLNNSINLLLEQSKKNLLPEIKPSLNNNFNNNTINNDNYLKIKNDNCINSNINIDNTNINIFKENNKKVTKKNLHNLLTKLMHNIDDNTEIEKQLEQKIEKLSNQNEQFIIQNQKMLQEIISKNEYNKKLEAVISFILEMIMTKPKIKNNSDSKNILLLNEPKNKLNNLNKSNNLDNLSMVNYTSRKNELNRVISKNNFINSDKVLEPFQSFMNKYLERTKNNRLLKNKETNYNKYLLDNFEYNSTNENTLSQNLIDNRNENNIQNNIQINPTLISKKRKRSESFNTILSNLTDGTNVIYDNSYKNQINENIEKEEEKKIDSDNIIYDENIDNNNINNDSFNSWNKTKNIFDIDLNQEEGKYDESDWKKDLLNNSQSSFNEFYNSFNINKDNEFCDI